MPGFSGWLETPAGRVARIGCRLSRTDRLGAWKARWGIGRMSYIVPAGLYAVGTPDENSPVVVTANYKMTFDRVRSALAACSLWLLVLETYGINVWCAAGKGTFGTEELVRRIESSGLARVVNHRRLLLPILGAPGVAAHLVTQRCGFAVTYAAIQADDLPAFLANGMITTAAMRELRFPFYDRLVLIPVEVVLELKTLITTAICVVLAFALAGHFAAGVTALGAYLGAALCGLVLAPLLLPWLPSRSFAVKGAVVGLLWALVCYLLSGASWSASTTLAAFLLLPAVSAFHSLNFTGCSTYTSRSGVKKELRIGLPLMVIAVVAGCLLLAMNLLPGG